MKRSHWFEILLIVAVMAIQLYAAFSDEHNFPRSWFTRDDAYYYFKVAENISLGHGSTFDGINPTNGYHPLWMLVCIPIFALARFDLILPLRILLIVLSFFSIATAILLYRLICDILSPPTGMLFATYWVFNFYIQGTFYKLGMESGIALFFLVLLTYQLYQLEKNGDKIFVSWQRVAWLGIFATLTLFSRLDLVFFVLIAGIWVVFRNEPMRYLMPLDILAIGTATLMAFVMRLGFPKYYELSSAALDMVVIGLLVKIPVYYFMNLYQRPAAWKPLELLKNISIAVILSSGAVAVLMFGGIALNIVPSIPRVALVADAILTFVILILIRLIAFGLRGAYPTIKAYSPLEYFKRHWLRWIKDSFVYYGIVGSLLSLYMLWNKFAFGTFMPISGQVKQWWSTFALNIYGSPASSFQSFFALAPSSGFDAWEPALSPIIALSNTVTGFLPSPVLKIDSQIRFFIFLAILGAVIYLLLVLAKKQRGRAVLQAGIIPLFVGSLGQVISYNSTGYVSPKEWYWLTELLVIILLTAFVLDIVLAFFIRRWHIARFGIWILVGLTCAYWAINYYQNTILQMTYQPTPQNTPYLSQIPFLESHTKPGDMIGVSGGGNFGYFIHDRTVINMDGLINSYQYYLATKKNKGADFLYDEGMRYIFANPDILKAPPYNGQYAGRLITVADYGDKNLLQLSAPNP